MVSSSNVRLTRQAENDLRDLQKTYQVQVVRHLTTLSSSVAPDGRRIKKLRGTKMGLFRLRAGTFRILFSVQENTVTIHRVIARKDLDRVIARLG